MLFQKVVFVWVRGYSRCIKRLYTLLRRNNISLTKNSPVLANFDCSFDILQRIRLHFRVIARGWPKHSKVIIIDVDARSRPLGNT